MKNVLFFIGTLSSGGAERVVSNLSLSLSDNIRKTILLFGKEAKVEYPYEGELRYLDRKEHRNLIQKTLVFKHRIKQIKNIKKDNDNGILISFLEYPNVINALTHKYGKTIVSVRNHMSTKHKKGIKAFLWNLTIKYLYPRADTIVAVSKEIKKDLVENYKIKDDKIEVIYNSYDIEKIKSLSNEKILDENAEIFSSPVIITMGRLDNQKGHWHLIRSFAQLKKEVSNAKLVFLGDGKLKDYLVNVAIELGVLQDIHFLGFQENPFKFIAKSKIFVLSSFFEGFPNSLVEAMTCEVPVISTDCLSGPREIIAPCEFASQNLDFSIQYDRYGILVPVFDGQKYSGYDPITKEEVELTNVMKELLIDKDIWKHFSMQSKVRSNQLSINNIIHEWENIIFE